MSDIIVDSCVLVKCVLAEEDSDQAERLFRSVRDSGDRLIVLDAAVAEAANAVWKQYHRGLITLSRADGFFEDLLVAPVEIRSAHRLLWAAFEIATKYDRTIYDSLFVALAHELRLPGITADEPLWRAVHADFPNIVLLRDWR